MNTKLEVQTIIKEKIKISSILILKDKRIAIGNFIRPRNAIEIINPKNFKTIFTIPERTNHLLELNNNYILSSQYQEILIIKLYENTYQITRKINFGEDILESLILKNGSIICLSNSLIMQLHKIKYYNSNSEESPNYLVGENYLIYDKNHLIWSFQIDDNRLVFTGVKKYLFYHLFIFDIKKFDCVYEYELEHCEHCEAKIEKLCPYIIYQKKYLLFGHKDINVIDLDNYSKITTVNNGGLILKKINENSFYSMDAYGRIYLNEINEKEGDFTIRKLINCNYLSADYGLLNNYIKSSNIILFSDDTIFVIKEIKI